MSSKVRSFIEAARTVNTITDKITADSKVNADLLENHPSSYFAPLASPALTGTPTAPTAALGTNTTQIATTAFVKTEVANLIDAAPTALDTLNELAAALGDDANYATTVTTALSTKVAKVTSTDNALVRFDGTDGSVQDSSWTCSDTGNLGYNIASPVSKLHLAASPVATTAYGTISLGGGIFDGVSAGKYSGTAQGTCLAINELSGYAGFLLDFQVAGVRKFSLTTATMNFTGGYIIAQSFQSSNGEIGTNTIIPLNIGLKSSNSFTTANTSQIVLARATMAQASGSNAAVKITPTYNQVSSSADNTDLLINRTETAVGSGAQYLIDAQVGGISKFCVTNGGNLGLCVVPSAWSDDKAIQLPQGAISSGYEYGVSISANAYRSASNIWKYTSGQAPFRFNTNNTGFQWYTAPAGTADNPITFTQAMTLDASGNLLVGTTSAITSGLTVFGSSSGALSGTYNSRNTSMASGRSWNFGGAQGDGFIIYGNNSGSFVSGVSLSWGGNSWVSQSDERTKEIIKPISGALGGVMLLRTVIGRYKTDDENRRRPFLIAQDVQIPFPEVVTEQSDEQKTLGIEYANMIPFLTAAIQEQQAMITELKARIEQLENK